MKKSAILLFFCLIVNLLQAQIRLKVIFRDGSGKQALQHVQVGLEGNSRSWQTDSLGQVEMELKAGRYTVLARMVGYFPFKKEIKISENQEITFNLEPRENLAEEVIVQATRSRSKDPGTFSEVDKAELEKVNLGQDLPILLQTQTSVLSSSDAGGGVGYTGISIRGSDATRINVTVNGIPLNDAESHGVFWVNMPDFASSVGNIQIQRGVGTSTNGAAAFGASLNMTTQNFRKDAYAEIQNSYGSFNTWKHTAQFGTGLLDGKWFAEGRVSRISSDGFIDRGSSDLRSTYLSAGYFGKKGILKMVILDGQEKTYQAWIGIPESRLRGDRQGMADYAIRNGLSSSDSAHLFQSNSRTYNSLRYKNQTDNYRQTHYQLFYSYDLGQHWLLNTALHYTRGAGYYEEFKTGEDYADYGMENPIFGNDTLQSTDLIRQRWLDNHFFGATYSLQYEKEGFRFTIGGASNRYMGDHFGNVIWAQNSTLPDNTFRYYFNKGSKNDLTHYAKASYELRSNLVLFGDLQVRIIRYQFVGPDQNLNLTDQQADFTFVNPKAGISWFPANGQHVYLSYGKSQREPVRDDFVNSSPTSRPKPEILHNVESGWKSETKTWRTAVNLYYMYYPNQLILTGQINDVGAYIRSNVENSSRMGMELEAAWAPVSWTRIAGNLTLSRNRIARYNYYLDNYDSGEQEKTTFDDTPIAFSPELIGALDWSFFPAQGLELGLIGKTVGRQYLDNTGSKSKSLDPYQFLNIRASWKIPVPKVRDFSVQLLVNNVLNQAYETNGYTFGYIAGGTRTVENFYYPQAGTNFLVGVKVGL